MGILRGINADALEPLINTVVLSGLKTLEITMNTSGAEELISKAREAPGGELFVGAGTVLNLEGLKKALDAGAEFIVSPVADREIIEYCTDRNIPVFPGAFTPTEALNAWSLGATMVKVFPSGMFGPKYIKEIKAPLDKIKVMAVGGVRPNNIKEYFDSGANAIAFGGSVFKKDLIAKGEFAKIGDTIKEYITAVKTIVTPISDSG